MNITRIANILFSFAIAIGIVYLATALVTGSWDILSNPNLKTQDRGFIVFVTLVISYLVHDEIS